MKKHLHILLLIIGIVIIFNGCRKDTKTEPFFTFGEVGNEWTFKRTVQYYGIHNDTTIIDTITIKITSNVSENLYNISGFPTYNWYISDTEFGLLDRYNNSLKILVNKYSIYNNDECSQVSSTDNGIIIYHNAAINCYSYSSGCVNTYISWGISKKYGIVSYSYSYAGVGASDSEDWELIDMSFD